MKHLTRGLVTAAMLAGALALPVSAFADGGGELTAASSGSLGTVASSQVSAPITVGDITYVPGPAVGGGNGVVLGTVLTFAVTAPITEGDITYVPD